MDHSERVIYTANYREHDCCLSVHQSSCGMALCKLWSGQTTHHHRFSPKAEGLSRPFCRAGCRGGSLRESGEKTQEKKMRHDNLDRGTIISINVPPRRQNRWTPDLFFSGHFFSSFFLCEPQGRTMYRTRCSIVATLGHAPSVFDTLTCGDVNV